MLVTGAAGFIGSHLIDRLLYLGYKVVGIDNLRVGLIDNLKDAFLNPLFSFYQVDISDQKSLSKFESRLLLGKNQCIDTVWHMAANSDIAAGAVDPRIDLCHTFMTTYEILGLMRRQRAANILFASSSAVYGEAAGQMREDLGPLLPISSYGAMKLAAEAAISAAVEVHVNQAFICRFPNVVGSRGTHGVIYDLVRKLKAQPADLEVLGNGLQRKPYLHVSELVDAMIFIKTNATERRALYNIGPEDEGVEVRKIAQTILETANIDLPIRYTGGNRGWPGDVQRFSYSTTKLRDLGWRSQLSSMQSVFRAINENATEQGLLCKQSF